MAEVQGIRVISRCVRGALLVLGMGMAVIGCSYRQANGEPLSPEAEVRHFLQRQYKDMPAELRRDTRYEAAFFDLNGDGMDEAITHVFGPRVCGSGGCDTQILQWEGSHYEVVTLVSVGFPPIRVLSTSSHGWRDLSLFVGGGGIRTPYEAVLSFDGTTYPLNPTIPPARPAPADAPGELLIPASPRGSALFQ